MTPRSLCFDFTERWPEIPEYKTIPRTKIEQWMREKTQEKREAGGVQGQDGCNYAALALAILM